MNVSCSSCKTVYRVDPAKVPAGGARARCSVCSNVMDVSPAGEATAPPAPRETTPQVRAAAAEPVAAPAPVAPPVEPTFVATEPPAPRPAEPAPAEIAAAAAPPAPPKARPQAQAAPAPKPTVEAEPAAPAATPMPARKTPPRRPRVTRPISAPRPSGPAARPATERPSAPVFRPGPRKPMAPAPVPPPAAPKRAAPAALVAEAPAVAAQSPVVTRPLNPFMSQDPQQKARRLARALVSDMIVYQPEKRQRALAAGRLKDEFEEEIKKSWEEYVQQVGRDVAESNPYFTEALNEILAGGQQIF